MTAQVLRWSSNGFKHSLPPVLWLTISIAKHSKKSLNKSDERRWLGIRWDETIRRQMVSNASVAAKLIECMRLEESISLCNKWQTKMLCNRRENKFLDSQKEQVFSLCSYAETRSIKLLKKFKTRLMYGKCFIGIRHAIAGVLTVAQPRWRSADGPLVRPDCTRPEDVFEMIVTIIGRLLAELWFMASVSELL